MPLRCRTGHRSFVSPALGFSGLLADTTTEHRLELARLPSHWWALLSLVLLAGLLYAVIWLYRHEARGSASPRRRAGMAVPRCLVLAILAVLWLQPTLATYLHRTIESRTLVMLDGSASMQLADAYPDAAEAARVRKFLASDRSGTATAATSGRIRRDVLQDLVLERNGQQWLRDLAARNRVELYRYGDEPKRLGTFASTSSRTATAPADEAGAPVTDLGRATRQAVDEAGAAPIAAVIVLGDGGINHGESVDTIARFIRARNVPIFAVGIGDPTPAQNIRIGEVVAPANAFVNDPFTITAHLSAQGIRDGPLAVELIDATSGERVVASATADIGGDGRAEPVVFRHQADRAGTFTYVVRAAPLPGELVTDDNSRHVAVRILERRMRVLLVAGSPQWDFQYVARLLERDRSVDVSCWLQSADIDAVREGTTVITELPRKPDQLFPYDVVALFDPQPRDFDPAWCELAQQLVSGNGGGLLYAAGPKYTARFFAEPDCRGITEMLPVIPDPEAGILLNQLGHFQPQAWPITIPPTATGHPVLAQADNTADNAVTWKRLTGVYWHYPVRREKPLATVLMRHSNPRMANAYGEHVLLATQFFGAGRTGFLAFDSTWRWRRYGETYFNRFWIQLLRHLMEGRLLGGSRRGIILTDRESFVAGEPIMLSARLLDGNYLPLDAPEVSLSADAENGGETTVLLQAESGRPGWFRGRFIPTQVGRVQFRISLPTAPGTPPEVVSHRVQIVRPNRETLHPQADPDRLRSLAEQSPGGRYVNLDEVDSIPDLIEDRNASLVITGTPILLADRYRWPLMATLLALLAAEWILRKRARLL